MFHIQLRLGGVMSTISFGPCHKNPIKFETRY